MKSSIKIALGENNQPVIHFNIVPSDDLRDQLCCQFLHQLGGESTLCELIIKGQGEPGSITHLMEITPVSPEKYLHYRNLLSLTS